MLQQGAQRVVCKNTLGFAESANADTTIMVQHSKQTATQLIDAAQKLFHNVVENFEVLAKQYETLKAIEVLTTEQFDVFVSDVIAPDPRLNPKFNPDGRMAETVLDRAMRKRAEVTRLWTEGKGHTGERNGWYAYNASVELLDHNTELFPNRGGAWRTASLLTGEFKRMKSQVLTNLLTFAEV